MKKIAKVIYNGEEDAFEIHFSTDGGKTYDMEVSYKCLAMVGKEDTNFIYWGILGKLSTLQRMGYELRILPYEKTEEPF